MNRLLLSSCLVAASVFAQAKDAGVAAKPAAPAKPTAAVTFSEGIATPESVLATTLMGTKAAEIFAGAAAIGGPRFLTPGQVVRIAGRPDEHYRQKALGL